MLDKVIVHGMMNLHAQTVEKAITHNMCCIASCPPPPLPSSIHD